MIRRWLFHMWYTCSRAGLKLGAIFSSSLLLSSLEVSDTQVYAPEIRALLGTASHFCETFVLKLRTVGGEQVRVTLPAGNIAIASLPTVKVYGWVARWGTPIS
jgi:hypothetical protein